MLDLLSYMCKHALLSSTPYVDAYGCAVHGAFLLPKVRVQSDMHVLGA
jgi:hypothetical protein